MRAAVVAGIVSLLLLFGSARAEAQSAAPDLFTLDLMRLVMKPDDPFPEDMFDGLAPQDRLPARLIGNCFLLPDVICVYVSEDGTLIGVNVAADAEDVASAVKEQMLEKGWHDMPSGVAGTETYFREKGECTWALISVCPVMDETSVVVRLR